MRHRENAKQVKLNYQDRFDFLAGKACAYSGADKTLLNTPSRKTELSKARCIIATILKRHNNIHNWQIGELLDRDHATTNAAIIRFNNYYDTDKEFRLVVDSIEKEYITLFGSKTDINSINSSISSKIFGTPFHSIEQICGVLIR
jgi:hypothetical protein